MTHRVLDVNNVNVSLHSKLEHCKLQARTTLNNSSLFDIITIVAFALSPFLYSRDNEAVQKLNGVMSSIL